MPAQHKEVSQTDHQFPMENEYTRCVNVLNSGGILTHLPQSNGLGVIGIDGIEYPLPTLERVAALFDLNREFVARKISQGFDALQLTPMAMPLPVLIHWLIDALRKHAADGKIYQTRHSPSDLLIPVRVNPDKQVWVWERLRERLDADEIIYFPQAYSSKHGGQSKFEVIQNRRICAFPGWSVGLVESSAFIPEQGHGKTLGGRRRLEIGASPRDYLQILQAQEYQGETGKTLEDFLIEFFTHLETTNEISHDRWDNNSLWLVGQYVKYIEQLKSDLVPTGWWHRDFGRLRLDAHRPGNKRCTRSWGVSTVVRLGSG
jgi:hypothetical protein